MSIVLLGKKIGMTRVFTDKGDRVPVTVISVESGTVVYKKTLEKDGYESLQLGFADIKEKKVTNPQKGHYEKAGVSSRKYLKESRVSKDVFEQYNVGDVITSDVFGKGDFVDVAAKSIGKGFAGGVKRWGYRGGRDTHGSMFHRAPGSIGASAYPSRVLKGLKLPGRMGGKRITAQSIEIIERRDEGNIIIVKGSVPGPKGGIVEIRKAKKKLSASAK
ncbi:MAG: 50S ribosomal protein L3 [Candidatus Auribacterota bacterium]